MQKKESINRIQNIVKLYDQDKQRLIKELKLLIKEGQRDGNVILTGGSYCALSVACYDQHDMDGMLTNALKAAELLKDTDAYVLLAKAYVNMGYAYSCQENYQMALGVNDKAYQIIHTHRIKGDIRFSAINNLATSYHMLGDYKMGIKLLTECLSLFQIEAAEDYTGLAIYTMNLADCYEDNQEFEKSRKTLKDMEGWLDKIPFKPIVCDYYLRCALTYYAMGDQKQGNEYVDRSFPLVPKDIYPEQIYDDYREIIGILVRNGEMERAIADYYLNTGNTEKALECHKKIETLYEKRMKEMDEVQLKVFQNIKAANAQTQRLKRIMRKNEELLRQEPLTKLLNRSALLSAASEYMDTATQSKQRVGAVFIDIDYFKECNDTYGHAVGDEIIRTVARACKKEESSNIRFARYGGDEFFGITRGLSDEEVTKVASRICRRIREADIPNEKNPNGQRVTLSVGVVNVQVSCSGETIIEIVKLADQALYHAKERGKNAIYLLEQKDNNKKGKDVTYRNISF